MAGVVNDNVALGSYCQMAGKPELTGTVTLMSKLAHKLTCRVENKNSMLTIKDIELVLIIKNNTAYAMQDFPILTFLSSNRIDNGRGAREHSVVTRNTHHRLLLRRQPLRVTVRTRDYAPNKHHR